MSAHTKYPALDHVRYGIRLRRQYRGNATQVPEENGSCFGGTLMIHRTFLAACIVGLAASAPAYADEFAKLPNASILPKGTVKVSGVVPGMGEHWANPKD